MTIASKSIVEANFVKEMTELASIMWSHGWDERNGGNISYIIDEDELRPYLDPDHVAKEIPFNGFGEVPENLVGKVFLVTATGSFFKNVEKRPSEELGIVRLKESGDSIDVLWGFEAGRGPTSEFPTHLLSHSVRLAQNPNHKVILHNHATNISAMTFVHSLNENELTRTLWGIISECLIVFPDGVSVIPWMVCGNRNIAEATAEKMRHSRIVLWPHHGILASGETFDDAYGLIETVEKAAQIYMLTYRNVRAQITDSQLKDLAQAFNVVPKEGILH
ncbi:MAG: rhamnulose-1-phosphate aldolase [Sporolactobacillus sp.]|uniref:Rhamnulose-1-phosphate aldolase n=1 Tax=Sporolactobacillus nakayamae TaxID=269670 RepID=A0A1I2QYU4_9BACL|nr:rhamnulose-1-phosphate aldolase [Sporolactobacillus nakayamae]SFG32439.1 L-rhamnulose 1-phosphate aldolase [Sporolactobacillus nakayamae]